MFGRIFNSDKVEPTIQDLVTHLTSGAASTAILLTAVRKRSAKNFPASKIWSIPMMSASSWRCRAVLALTAGQRCLREDKEKRMSDFCLILSTLNAIILLGKWFLLRSHVKQNVHDSGWAGSLNQCVQGEVGLVVDEGVGGLGQLQQQGAPCPLHLRVHDLSQVSVEICHCVNGSAGHDRAQVTHLHGQ